mmetsp:Transcript_58276/g.181028  ORF Transcript_58276/g.181028 Transcript_58276/m.181028 type:complete len:281 (+) Transcript_58276:74-916(+)
MHGWAGPRQACGRACVRGRLRASARGSELGHELARELRERQVLVEGLEVRRPLPHEGREALLVVRVGLLQRRRLDLVVDGPRLIGRQPGQRVGLLLEHGQRGRRAVLRELLGEGQGVRQERLLGQDPLHQPLRQLLGLDRVAREEEHEGVARAHEVGQDVAHALLRDEAALGEDGADLRVLGGEAQVAGQRHAEADADAATVDAGDHRQPHLADVLEAPETPGLHLLPALQPGLLLLVAFLVKAALRVCASAEGAALASDHHDADGQVVLPVVQRLEDQL